jgi:hypothetical protein
LVSDPVRQPLFISADGAAGQPVILTRQVMLALDEFLYGNDAVGPSADSIDRGWPWMLPKQLFDLVVAQ